jgi:3-phenylpropionate/cinnamic acid dioxygenase small subunit
MSGATEIDAATRRRFEDFVYHEARLMDGNRYDEWFALWTPDALYWVPTTDDESAPEKAVAIVYEKLGKIEDRVLRLKGKYAHAQKPRSRLMRVVSNFELEPCAEGLIVGTSRFVLGEIRNDRQLTYFGRNRHVLVETDAGLRMREKRVFLLNSGATTGNMTFLI